MESSACLGPAFDVRGVLIGNSDGKALKFHVALVREVEDVFLGIVQESLAVDGFVMPDRNVIGDARIISDVALGDRDGLDPVDHVLKMEAPAKDGGDLPGSPGLGRANAEIEEQRPPRSENALDLRAPLFGPLQIGLPRKFVVIAAVIDPKVVGGRGDDQVHRSALETLGRLL